MIIKAWINGNFVSASEAVLPVNDLGLLRAYSIFDYLRTCNGKPFLAEEYIKRFLASAGALHLQYPLNAGQLMDVINELARKATSASDIGIRLVLTGGNTPDGISPSVPNLIMTAETFAPVRAHDVAQGVKLIMQEFMRELPHVKTTNYMNAIRFRNGRKDYYDVLYHYNDRVLETSRNNIFLFIGDKLITPGYNILAGVTRRLVLGLAAGDFDVEEREVTIKDLMRADEVFVTGTTKGILPVTRIDDHAVGSLRPGKRTMQLLDKLQEYMKRF